MRNCKKCGVHIPWSVRLNGVRIQLNARVYCLGCSPFNERTFNGGKGTRVTGDTKTCLGCEQPFPLESFRKKHRGRADSFQARCARCMTIQIRKKRNAMKLAAVALLGGKCESCGYNRCVDALSFHHLDPAEKDFELADMWKLRGTHGLSAQVRAELMKCALLCMNCHVEEHARQRACSSSAPRAIRTHDGPQQAAVALPLS